ncbi:MAG: PAS domain S-box protein [Anaerolineae bacterium]|nr:PAS domain S-box protein [Anaerolineae bacterium]
MYNPRRPPSWLVACSHVILLAFMSWLIIQFELPDSLLFIFTIPCVLASFLYGRHVYVPMIIVVVAAAVWVTYRVSPSFVTSLVTIIVATCSALAMSEMVRALALTRMRAQETLNRQNEKNRYLAEMGAALLDCDRADQVLDRFGTFLAQVTSDVIIIVNQTTPDQQSVITRRVIGLDETLLAQAENLVGFKVIGKVSAIPPNLRAYLFQARLQKLPGGLGALSASEIPAAVSDAAQYLIGFHDIFVAGITDGNAIWGNVYLITRQPEVDLPAQLIEAVVYQCFSALSRISAVQDLAASEEKYRLLFQNLTAGFALHEIIADEDQHPRDYRLLEVNPAFEQLTGYAGAALVGRTARETLPPTESRWVEVYDQVATTGEPMPFETYSPEMRRWYQVVAYLPEPGRLATILQDITGRKQTEQALHESEERYRSLYHTFRLMTDSMNDFLWAKDMQGRFTFVNQAMCDHLLNARDTDEPIGKTDMFFANRERQAHPDNPNWHTFGETCINSDEVVMRTQRPGRFNEFGYVNGQFLYLDVQKAPIWNASGEIIGTVGSGRVITREKELERERQDMEAVLQISLEKYRVLFESFPLGITVTDEIGRILEANRVSERLLGISVQEHIQRKIDGAEWQIIRSDGTPMPAQEYASVRALTENRRIENVEMGIIKSDGEIIWINVTAAPIPLDGYGVAVTYGDITERKQAETVLARYRDHLEDLVQTRTTELQAQYAQLDAILRSVSDAIFMTDPEQRIQYVNPAFTTLTGYPAEEVLGQDVGALEILMDFTPRLQAFIPTLFREKRWQGDVCGQRKDGRRYDAALTITPVHDDDGEIIGHVFTQRDISQAKDLERARNQFIANVSHQFRTPLTPLKTSIYLLLRAKPEEKQRRQLQAMESSIDWLIQLVEDTLEISALDSGKGAEIWAPVSLPDVIAEILVHYEAQAQAAGVTLKVAPTPPLPPIQGDAKRLAQAVSELVENAIVFTPVGGRVTLAVQPELLEGETWVAITVQDTGHGITSEELPRLFERFFRGRLTESGHTAGVGLGLSIAQKIAEAHGGRITVQSKVGQGSTFTLWLRPIFQGGKVS